MKVYSFDEYYSMKNQLDRYLDNMMRVVDDYVNTNEEFRKNHGFQNSPSFIITSDSIYKNSFKGGGYKIDFKLKNYQNGTMNITDEEYNDLVEYMKDTELYKSTKKFNL